MLIPFTKMHGLGNDFMVLDLVNHDISLDAGQIRRLADRHFGVGFDQLLQVEPPSSPEVDFDYRIFNSDGGEVEHCGNGARCFAVFVHRRGLTSRNPIRVKTRNRILELTINPDGDVTVDMGTPRFEPADIPLLNSARSDTYRRELADGDYRVLAEFAALSMGNPHAVLLVDDVDAAPVERLGRLLGSHGDFPAGVNVGFLQVVNRGRGRLRVFERGAGETLACGTGACAAAVAGIRRGLLDNTVTLELRGGNLVITWHGGDGAVLMTGPATAVFEGRVEI